MSEKAANVQRKKEKKRNLRKPEELLLKNHLKVRKKSGSLEAKHQDMRNGNNRVQDYHHYSIRACIG